MYDHRDPDLHYCTKRYRHDADAASLISSGAAEGRSD